MADLSEPTSLGTLLRHLLDVAEADITAVSRDLGLVGYRPRYSPVVRTLVADGPMSIRDLARSVGVTHSAASQTVASMARDGLVTLEPGEDARQRIVHPTERTRELLPAIEAEWAATDAAIRELDAELPMPLAELLTLALQALHRRPLRERIAATAAYADHQRQK